MSLIQNAKSNPQAFVELYDRYVERIYQYMLRRLRDREEAEDLSAQVWEKVLTKIGDLKTSEETGFAAWLFTIARNELNQHFRGNYRYKLAELSENVADENKTPKELLDDNLNEDLIQKVLSKLPTQQRETVELKYFADLKNKEIATIFGISEKTVASNLSRAMDSLGNYLEKITPSLQ